MDSFSEENVANDVGFVPQGTVMQICDSETGLEMYTIEGKGAYSDAKINIEEERAHIRNAIHVVASPTTKKRGKTKPGYGEVWAVGNRYRYTEPRNSELH